MTTEVLNYGFASADTLSTDSTGSYHSSLVSGTAQVTDVGTYGNTAHFDGTTCYAMGTYPPTLANNSARSVSVWVYPTETDLTDHRIMDTGTGSTVHEFRRKPNGTLQARNSFFGVASSQIVPLNQWTHVGFTYQPNTVKLFINGEKDGQNDNMWCTLSDDLPMKYVGGNNDSNFFTGNMLDFRVYDETLSETSMADIYAEGPTVAPSISVTMYARMAHLTWDTAADGSSYTITVVRSSDNATVRTVEGITESEYTVNGLSDGETYTFILSTDTEEYTSPTTIALALDTTTAAATLDFVSNNLTSLGTDAEDFLPYLDQTLETNDILYANTSHRSNDTHIARDVALTFVSEGDTIPITESLNLLTPFSTTGSTDQSVNLLFKDGSTSANVTYDDSTDSITVEDSVHTVGDKTIIDGLQMKIAKIL